MAGLDFKRCAVLVVLLMAGCASQPQFIGGATRDTYAQRVMALYNDPDGKPIPPCDDTTITKECVVR